MMEITAQSGQSITLPCNATRYTPIKTLEWSRADQNKHIIFCPNQKSDPVVLENCYKGRVLLGDRKEGNASLTLINVRAEDAGIYECYVQRGTSRTKRAVELISTIRLEVKGESSRLLVLDVKVKHLRSNVVGSIWSEISR